MKGRRVLAVEDTSTTGGSVLTAVEALREAGAEVVAVAVIVDRSTGARRRWSRRAWSTGPCSGSRTWVSADARQPVLLVLLAVLVGGGLFYFNYLPAKKRRELFAGFAAQQGWSYLPSQQRAGRSVVGYAVPDR